jgi:hypothetical protein
MKKGSSITAISLGLIAILTLSVSGCVVHDGHGGGRGGYHYSSYDDYYRHERANEWRYYEAERARRMEVERRASQAERARLERDRLMWERQQQQHRQQQHQAWERNKQQQNQGKPSGGRPGDRGPGKRP